MVVTVRAANVSDHQFLESMFVEAALDLESEVPRVSPMRYLLHIRALLKNVLIECRS